MNLEDLNPYKALIQVGVAAAVVAALYFGVRAGVQYIYQQGYDSAHSECTKALNQIEANNEKAREGVKSTADKEVTHAADKVQANTLSQDRQPATIKYVAVKCPLPSDPPANSPGSISVFTDEFIADLNGIITDANNALKLGESK